MRYIEKFKSLIIIVILTILIVGCSWFILNRQYQKGVVDGKNAPEIKMEKINTTNKEVRATIKQVVEQIDTKFKSRNEELDRSEDELEIAPPDSPEEAARLDSEEQGIGQGLFDAINKATEEANRD